ncbi:hypothetical protein V1477_012007 [Vespula maculifrons]|uniref:Uncharacterized protein n=1 Tax=Vespula maculifrons TaxID=7453 RepID=A0ABD2C2K7_VESMC
MRAILGILREDNSNGTLGGKIKKDEKGERRQEEEQEEAEEEEQEEKERKRDGIGAELAIDFLQKASL